MPAIENNRIVIRIWTSTMNKRRQGEDVGHVSIEIPSLKAYYSLWPGESLREAKDILRTVKPKYMAGYRRPLDWSSPYSSATYDFEAEGRASEFTICLYGLDTATIDKKFQRIKKYAGYSLIGDNWLINQRSSHSCASLAYQLLKAGGFDNLIPTKLSSMHSSVIAPDLLAETVMEAKRQELRLYPHTRDFTWHEETSIANITAIKVQKFPCTIL